MNRNGKDGGVPTENSGRAISMMDISVHDHGSLDSSICLEPAHSNSHIVNGAKSFTVIGAGMMKAAAQIRTKAIAQGRLRRQNCAASRQPDGLREFLRIGDLQ